MGMASSDRCLRRVLYRTVGSVRKVDPLWRALRAMYMAITPDKDVRFSVGRHEIFMNPKDRGIGQKLYLTGGYAAGRTRLIAECVRPGQTVVDLGANIGFFTFQMAELVGETGRVIAVEPDPRNFRLLKKSIENAEVGNITPVMCAASNENKKGKLFVSDSVTANTIVEEVGYKAIDMEIVTLDSLLPELGVKRVDFVKMDTDGSEPLAIQGMKSFIEGNSSVTILMEYSPGNLRRYFKNPMDCLSLIQECGIAITKIIDTEDESLHPHALTDLQMLRDEENLDILFGKVG